MKSKRAISALMAVLLMSRLAPAALAAENAPEEEVPAALQLNTNQHVKFMGEQPDGLFHPQDSFLRQEAAQMLYGLLIDPPQPEAVYPDLPEDAEYALSVGVLGEAGLLLTDSDGRIRPADPITRAEFASMLRAFLPNEPAGETSFSDVPSSHWAYEAITASAACGLFGGYSDGTFRPEGSISRGEAAVVMCRLLGRSADLPALASADTVSVFPDVPRSFWAYGPVMEASVTHTHYYDADGVEYWDQAEPRTTALADGFYSIGNRLYRVQEGQFLRSVTIDGFTYDADGRYTTGSDYLDQRLSQIIGTYTNSSMTQDEKLRALYNYVRDNYTYLKRDLVSKDAAGWENAFAEEFLKTGYGNCFSFAAAYCLLARQLGLPAHTVVGKLGTTTIQDHGWVEIPLDGKTYLFDVELEWSYLHKYKKVVNLFKVDIDHAPYTYTR